MASFPATGRAEGPAQRRRGQQVGPGLFAIQGTDPTLPNDDLAALRKIVGNARYVGVGEPVHTSGGFYQMRHRIFRFLVEEMGFRALAIESRWRFADLVSQYVATCQGDQGTTAVGLFGVWRSEEMTALLRWMCAWNTAHPGDPVYFYGIDLQSQAADDANALIAFLARLGIADNHPWVTGIRACDGVVDSFYPSTPIPEERYAQCQGALSEVAAWFDAHQQDVIHATSWQDLGWARVALVGEQRAQELTRSLGIGDFPAGYAARDRGMAYLTQAIHDLRFPHARTMIWAHNGHITENTQVVTAGLLGMGDLLYAELGDKYRNIGMTAHVINIDWTGVGCGMWDYGATASSVENVLHDLGLGPLLVELRPRGMHAGFFDTTTPYSIGDFLPGPMPSSYNALVYLEVSPMMHPLAWPACN